MKLLAIESSCDETAAAVVEDGRKMLSNIIASQVKEHVRFGGVVPEILPCIGCTQPGRWHCYDVWQHSAAAVAALDLRGQDTRGVRVLCWATFLHDIAKPQCRTVGPDGAAHFKGHNQRGAQAARTILRRLKAPAYLTDLSLIHI